MSIYDHTPSEEYVLTRFSQDRAAKVAEIAEIQAERSRIMGDAENEEGWNETAYLERSYVKTAGEDIGKLELSEDERESAEAAYEREYAGKIEEAAKAFIENEVPERYISDAEFNAFASEQRRQLENIRGEGRANDGRDSEGRDGEGRGGEGRGGEGREGEGRGGDFKRVSADGIDFGPGDLGDLPSQAVTLALAAAQKVEIA